MAPLRPRASLREILWRLDPIGVCLLICAFVCLLFALQWAGVKYRWSDPKVLGCLLGFGFLFGAFLFMQYTRKERCASPHPPSYVENTAKMS